MNRKFKIGDIVEFEDGGESIVAKVIVASDEFCVVRRLRTDGNCSKEDIIGVLADELCKVPPADQKIKADNVNSPAHYTQGQIECIDYIEDKLTAEEFRGYCKGNVLKYLTRERHKGGDEDIRKAKCYLDKLCKKFEDYKG